MIEWLQYPAVFLAGVFLTNAVPHFVHGISGNKFPTPFAKPRGVGLSGSITNMLWALFNVIIGCLLLLTIRINNNHKLLLVVFIAGVALTGIGLSIRFRNKHKE